MVASRLLALLLFAILLLPVPAKADPGVAPSVPNLMGFYTTIDCAAEHLDTAIYVPVEIYLVATNPVDNYQDPMSQIGGFECSLDIPYGAINLASNLSAPGVNVGNWPEFIVGFNSPVFVYDGAAHLMTQTLMLTDPMPQYLFLQPVEMASIPGKMGIVDFINYEIVPQESSSLGWDTPDFGFNSGPLWSNSGCQITINPQPSGIQAPWELYHNNSGQTFTGSGETVLTQMDEGTYQITWQEVAGYALPDPATQALTVYEGGAITFTGIYTESNTGVAPDMPNVIGLYTTEECGAEYLVANQFDQPTLYLVATNPVDIDGTGLPVTSVMGFECSLELDPGLLLIAVEYPGNALNVTGPPDFVVGYSTPLPVGGDACVLASIRFLYTTTEPELISLMPSAYTSIPDFMVLWDGDTEAMIPQISPSLRWDTPDFGFNTGPLWTRGTCRVAIDPQPQGLPAPWELLHQDSGWTYASQGSMNLDFRPEGTYVLTWQDVEGYNLPDPVQETLTVLPGETITFTGNYTLGFALTGVEDVPNDQGRQVRLTWNRNPNDAPDQAYTITGYGIYRKQDDYQGESGDRLAGWDYIDTVPARGNEVYQFVAPTLCDSTITHGLCESTFMVSAMTPSPLVYFDTEPMSGYSVDNLRPVMPAGLTVAYAAGGNQLSWDNPVDPDVDHYLVYRSTEPAFPGGAPLAQVHGTGWTDDQFARSAWDYSYWLVAVDHAGNTSDPAAVSQTSGAGEVPGSLTLMAAYPNPFNPSTTLAYRLPAEQDVRLAVYGLDGRLVRTLVDEVQTAGLHEAVWTGRDARGRRVSSGTYFYRLEAGGKLMQRSMTLIK